MKTSDRLENTGSAITEPAAKVKEEIKIEEAIALITMSMFLGGCLVIGFILVPFWQSMEPIDFSKHFLAWAPSLSVTMLSLELMGQISIIMAFSSNRNNVKTRGLWLLSLISFAMTFVLIFLYFAKTNDALMHATINPNEIHNTLMMWQAMHFIRIGFSVLAVLFCTMAIVQRKSVTFET